MLTFLALSLTTALTPMKSPSQVMLTAGKTVELPLPGRFDYMNFDPYKGYVLASHTQAHTLTVYNIHTHKVVELPTGTVNGQEVVHQWNRIYAGGGGDVLCEINESNLKIIKKVKLEGHGDALAVDTRHHLLFQCHDDHHNIWVFGARNLSYKGSIDIGGVPEYLVFDPRTDLIYVNIKHHREIKAINPVSMKVVKTFSTGKLDTPSGLVFDAERNVLVCAGRNGIAESFDPKTGKMVGKAEITDGIDQSALDPRWHVVYSDGHGSITAVQITKKGLVSAGNTTVNVGAHTLAVDPKTHDVWICYADATKAYLQVYHVMSM